MPAADRSRIRRRRRFGAAVLGMMLVAALATAAATAGPAQAGVGLVPDQFDPPPLGPQWELVRPLGVGSAQVAGGRLALSVPAGASHDPWTSNDAVRVVQPVADGDLSLQAGFDSMPSAGYQMQGLTLEQAPDAFLRFEVHHTGTQLRLFGSTTVAGTPKTRINKLLPALTTVHLRVARSGDSWTLSWSPDGASWAVGTSFTHPLSVNRVGPFVGNYRSSGDAPAFTALVDYLVDTLDTDPPDPPTPDPTGSPSPDPTGSPSPDPTFSPTPDPTGSPSPDPTGSPDPGGQGPAIDVWYGPAQSFPPGPESQRWVNLLGNVSDPDGVTSLRYRLNGGAPRALSIGPDHRRLQWPGDFNVDIAYPDLAIGPNTVTLEAVDGLGWTSERVLTVERQSPSTAGLPFQQHWQAGVPVAAQAQVVDGAWTATGAGGLRTSITGYDRLVAVGDVNWSDYRLTVPVTVHALGPAAYTHLSGPPLIGVGLRWRGHTPAGSDQPAWNWYPTGAFAWYRFYETGGKFVLSGNGGSPATYTRPAFAIGTTYQLTVRVTTLSSGDSRYQVKLWPAGAPEPAGWLSSIDVTGGPGTGSILLIAHQLDGTFGTVTVQPA